MSHYHQNSIFWVEVGKIRPNPFQPRKEFSESALYELADSIRQYGVLQPLVVTRKEEQRPDGGISVYYELIAGERRLRASKIAGLDQVPVIIRKDTSDKLRLELAIIENLQREDLNAIDRALAFERLKQEFNLTNADIGRKIGKSRVYVSNTLRILGLPEEIKSGLVAGKISEGHTRPLLMLSDRPEEQMRLYREIVLKNLSVREAEKIARRIAQDRVRKKKFVVDPRIREYEKRLSENLGTRVQIEQREHGGKILIDYFSVEDLEKILNAIQKVDPYEEGGMMEHFLRKHASTLEEVKVHGESEQGNSSLGESNLTELTPLQESRIHGEHGRVGEESADPSVYSISSHRGLKEHHSEISSEGIGEVVDHPVSRLDLDFGIGTQATIDLGEKDNTHRDSLSVSPRGNSQHRSPSMKEVVQGSALHGEFDSPFRNVHWRGEKDSSFSYESERKAQRDSEWILSRGEGGTTHYGEQIPASRKGSYVNLGKQEKTLTEDSERRESNISDFLKRFLGGDT